MSDLPPLVTRFEWRVPFMDQPQCHWLISVHDTNLERARVQATEFVEKTQQQRRANGMEETMTEEMRLMLTAIGQDPAFVYPLPAVSYISCPDD